MMERTALSNRETIGLVTGSQPFAGLPTNPAERVLGSLDGMRIGDCRLVAVATPVSFATLPELLNGLIERHRPAFVLGLGLALGAPVICAETFALNAAHFSMGDNAGRRPVGGQPFDPGGPAARRASWDAEAVVGAIMDRGIPARLSFHAGTHLCNLTLYTYLTALARAGLDAPCGFLHLPYLPEQVVWLMRNRTDAARQAPGQSFDIASMPLDTQRAAILAAIEAMAQQAGTGTMPQAAGGTDVTRELAQGL
jgi:pyroglutamyl-peptidase